MKKKDIAVVGRVAEGTELLDGQTVKTKILYEELKKEFPDRISSALILTSIGKM